MNKNKKIQILIYTVAGIIILPFIFGLYAIGPVAFPCSYKESQGKLTLRKLNNEMQGLQILDQAPSRTDGGLSGDCLTGSLQKPVKVSSLFKLASPISLSNAESEVLANSRIKGSGQQEYKTHWQTYGSTSDPTMREIRITEVEARYKGAENRTYKVNYTLESPVACTSPTPRENKLDSSQCSGKTAIESYSLMERPVKTIGISRNEVPAKSAINLLN